MRAFSFAYEGIRYSFSLQSDEISTEEISAVVNGVADGS